MQRQTLRSKSGCNRCKLRRKKCNERRPVCSTCERLNLICTWGAEAQQTHLQNVTTSPALDSNGTVPRSAIRRLPLSKNLSSGILAFRNQTQFDLTVSFPDLFKATLAPTASAEFRDLSMFVTVALRNEGVRNAMTAITGAMLFMESDEFIFGQESLENYQHAVVTLRRSIAQGLEGRDPTELYIMANALGMVEACGLGNPRTAACHFAASAGFWSRIAPDILAHETTKAICKCQAECWLWFLGTLVMFLNKIEIDQVMSCIDWSTLKTAFQPPPDSSLPAWTQSPHLAIDHSIYRLIIQVTHFSRQEHPPLQRRQQLALWLSEIESIDSAADVTFVGLPPSVSNTYTSLTKVYAHTLRIFLIKLSSPDVCASHARIKSSFSQAISYLETLEMGNCEVQMCYWPFCILLCAAGEKHIFQSLVARMHTSRLDTGSVRMLNRIVKVVQSLMRKEPCSTNKECSKEHDGLDFLLHRDGITAFEDEHDSPFYESLEAPRHRPFVIGLWRILSPRKQE